MILNTHTRRGLVGLYDTHNTYDTRHIINWKIGGSFALLFAEKYL